MNVEMPGNGDKAVVGYAHQYPGAAGKSASVFDPTGKYKLQVEGAFSAVEVSISATDSVKSESGAMISMSHNVDIDTKMEGGLGGAFCRCCCTGESIFFSHFLLKPGEGDRGDVLLAPGLPGEIMMLDLDGVNTWCLQKGAFLACDHSVIIGTKTQNVSQGCCSGQGFFIIEASGRGRLLVNSYGSIVRYDLQPGEKRKIDNGALVAWTGTTNYTIAKASSGLVNTFLSGEGFVCQFTGPGTIYAQTRSVASLAAALIPYLPAQSSGGGGGGGD